MLVDNPVELRQVPYFFREHCFSGLLGPFTVTDSKCVGYMFCEPRLF